MTLSITVKVVESYKTLVHSKENIAFEVTEAQCLKSWLFYICHYAIHLENAHLQLYTLVQCTYLNLSVQLMANVRD